MDLINNLIFTALNNVGSFGPLQPQFVQLPSILNGPPVPQNRGTYFSYNIDIIEEFCSFDDSDFIDNAIQKHWNDLAFGRNYTDGGTTVFTSFRNNVNNDLVPLYHMIYAYLVENTRIAQIFERLIFLFMHDEKLNKATTPENRIAFQWIINTENLFFKNLPNSSYRNISSMIRLFPDATRRNAYFRMFGMDLAFGDLQSNAPVTFHKAEFNNQSFIAMFESFLSEIWQAYTNAKNQMGPNTTDMIHIVDTGQKLQEMLMSRRTTEATFNNYRYFNLSREEYAAVVMMSWLFEVVAYDSPVINFLRCNGTTPGERLSNIGKRVGVPAHSKSEGLLDIAPPMNTLLRRIELGDYSNEGTVTDIVLAQVNSGPTDPPRLALNDLLLIINNWEKATGHKIKNPQAVVNGTVKVDRRVPAPAMS